MTICASHSPLLYFPARRSEPVLGALEALATAKERIAEFAPDLVIVFGTDHYGGQQMYNMPAFCIGTKATALADVGGTPGVLDVPADLAVSAVRHLRKAGIDVAISYDMTVDHGFSQVLKELAGGVATYPVLPIFTQCIQPPFVHFSRARALGAAMGEFIRSLPEQRILILGTGGLSHDPGFLFPPIDTVEAEWKPYILNGVRQSEVPQQAWIDYEIAAHEEGARVLGSPEIPLHAVGISEDWDAQFIDMACSGRLAEVDGWDPYDLCDERGVGTLEVLVWIAALEASNVASGTLPRPIFQRGVKEIGVGFGMVQAGPSRVLAPAPA